MKQRKPDLDSDNSSHAEEIREIEEEIRKTPYNKATQGHIGRLKARLARLKMEREKKSGGKPGLGYAVKKQGDATVVLVGFPSVGKSTLLNRLSNAESKTGGYDFTTLDVVPGVMEYNGAKIQVLDVPGFIEGASMGKGRGKEVLSVLRSADLILMIVDNREPRKQIEIIKKELYDAGFRLDTKPPDVKIEKKNTGGLQVGSAVRLTKLSLETVKGVLLELGLKNAEVVIREDIDINRLIDSLMKNRVYVPSLTVLNKADISTSGIKEDFIRISALKGTNIDRLKEKIWDSLGLMRVYLKKIGKQPDMKEPLIVKRGSSVRDVCSKIHKEFAQNFRFARIWGSGKFPGQRKGPDYILKDRDVVELHM